MTKLLVPRSLYSTTCSFSRLVVHLQVECFLLHFSNALSDDGLNDQPVGMIALSPNKNRRQKKSPGADSGIMDANMRLCLPSRF